MDEQELREEGLIASAGLRTKGFTAVFVLVYMPLLKLGIPPAALTTLRIFITLLGLLLVGSLIQIFRTGLKMGLSHKGGNKLTATVWTIVLLVLLLLYLHWLPVLSAL